MTINELMEFLELLRKLPEEKQKQMLYMIMGATLATKQ